MALHADILVASGREWGEYLEGLRSQDKQAIYTTVGKNGLHHFDFSLTFADRQKIHEYRTRLSVALHALETNIDIVQGCKARCRHLAKHSDSSRQARAPATDTQPLRDQFEWHLTELKGHKRAARSIIEHCTWTANLQEKILEYRNDETMQTHSQALRDFASAQKTEAENMTRLTRQTAQDSKMLKALTVMATLYLPATLLATIFSSTLVQLESLPSTTAATTPSLHFILARDFWIYIAVAVPLTASTALLVAWIRRRAAAAGGLRRRHTCC
ncbi:MAG: hypothetical protein Q9208_008269 [Pyrenodesmia sp. 3 TL-2023]